MSDDTIEFNGAKVTFIMDKKKINPGEVIASSSYPDTYKLFCRITSDPFIDQKTK